MLGGWPAARRAGDERRDGVRENESRKFRIRSGR
jgi:hypothetical protein